MLALKSFRWAACSDVASLSTMALPPFPKLRNLNLPARFAGMLRLKYLNQKGPYSEQLDVLSNPMDPKSVQLRDEYSKSPENTLRWRVTTNMSKPVLGKAVLRERLKRKWASAFEQALNRKGYGRDGRVLPNSGNRTDLKGTLEINIYGGMGFDKQFETLIEQAGNTLDAVKERQDDWNWSADAMEATKTNGNYSRNGNSRPERTRRDRDDEPLVDPIMDSQR